MAPRSEAIPRTLEDLAQPHIESFDYFLGDGMKSLVEDLHPVQVRWCYPLALSTGGWLLSHHFFYVFRCFIMVPNHIPNFGSVNYQF